MESETQRALPELTSRIDDFIKTTRQHREKSNPSRNWSSGPWSPDR